MNIRLTKSPDLPAMMRIIQDAQIHLATQQIDQWQDGYPNESIIKNDIQSGNSYVIINENSEIVATTMFTTAPESTYSSIDGDWFIPVHQTYGVIHRLAISAKHRNQGIAKFVFNHFENELSRNNHTSMKVDTHRGNKGMQHMLTSIGYKYCGVIYLNTGDERLAFEKVLK
ncbi:MAG: putative GNAT superfamily acetyltransferase [Salibacteraceae bacterium]|jgi:predicted GNAT superfamily acetyltransferase